MLGDPHDHRASTMKVNSHILSLVFHRSLLPFSGCFGDPECALHIRFLATGGAPAVRRSLSGSSNHDWSRLVRRPCPHDGDRLRRSGAALLHDIKYLLSRWLLTTGSACCSGAARTRY